jgi:hypothetical protein
LPSCVRLPRLPFLSPERSALSLSLSIPTICNLSKLEWPRWPLLRNLCP